LVLEVARAGAVGAFAAAPVAGAEVRLVHRALEIDERREAQLPPERPREVPLPEVILLGDLRAVGPFLEARREDGVHVPEEGARAVLEARERRDAAELKADVAVSADEGEAGGLVTRSAVVDLVRVVVGIEPGEGLGRGCRGGRGRRRGRGVGGARRARRNEQGEGEREPEPTRRHR
jgi:hypothetical protein